MSVLEWEPAADADRLAPPSSLGLWSVLIYLALFLIRPWEELIPQLQAIRFERIYALLMLAAVIATGRGWRISAQGIAVAGMAGAAGLSTVQAWQTEHAWPQLYQFLTVVITFYVIRAACRTRDDLIWVLLTYIGTMHVYLSKSLWEYFVHNRHVYAQGVNRLLGIEVTYGEPNAVAMSTVLSLPLWWFLWCERSMILAGWGELARRGLLAGLMSYPCLAVLAVGLTNSRAGMVGLAAFVVGVVWMSSGVQRRGQRVAWIGMLLVGLFVLAPGEQRDRLRTLWNPNAGPANARESAGGRWQGFLAAMEMVRARPATGVGLGNFVPYRVAYVDGVALVAHNLPGQILGEMGLVGAVAFVVMTSVLWRTTTRIRSQEEDDSPLSQDTRLALAIRLTVLLLLLFGLSLHNGLRYNWLWLAAFADLCWEFAQADAIWRGEREG